MDSISIISNLLAQLDTDTLIAEISKREGKRKLKMLSEREQKKNQYKDRLKRSSKRFF